MSQLQNQLLHLKEQFPSTQKTRLNEKDSFLFSQKESAKIRSQDIHILGLDGINELIVLDNRFRKFKEELFDTNSVNFKRELQTNDVNDNLNQKLKNLLRLISPYFLLNSSHKVIEYLIRVYL
jgi:U3 small nucleolar RNA-associated protein 10